MRLLPLAALAALLSFPAQAEGLYVKYHVNLIGVKVGEGRLSMSFSGDSYSLSGSGNMAAFGRLVSDAQATVSAKGTVSNATVKPSVFNMDAVGEGKPNKVNLAMNKGTVTSRSVHPKQDKLDQRIKLTSAHQKGIVDPMSALVFPAPKGMHPESCNRTLKIYDGRERYDLVMKYKRQYRHKGSRKNYSGPMLVCSAQYKPIAGHRPNRKTIKDLQANRSGEVHLAEIKGQPYLVLYKASLDTPVGHASVTSVRMKPTK